MICLQASMSIPSPGATGTVLNLNEADSTFDQSSRCEQLLAEAF